jgi:hypothetical protein
MLKPHDSMDMKEKHKGKVKGLDSISWDPGLFPS